MKKSIKNFQQQFPKLQTLATKSQKQVKGGFIVEEDAEGF